MAIQISPEKMEQGGILMTFISAITLNQWIGIVTCAMGVASFIIGNVRASRDRKIKAGNEMLDMLLKQRQIESEELEIEMMRLEKEGFVRRMRAKPMEAAEASPEAPPAPKRRRRDAPPARANGGVPP